MRSMTPTEASMFDQMARSMMGQAADAGKNITAEQACLCAAMKIYVWRTEGLQAATKRKIGKIPADYPDVDLKPVKEKVQRVRRALPGESEAEIQAACIKYMKAAGWLVIRFNSGATMIEGRYFRAYTIENSGESSGVSDLICFRNGQHLFVEVKTKTGSYTDAQRAFAELAASFGEEVHTVRSLDDCVRLERSVGRTRLNTTRVQNNAPTRGITDYSQRGLSPKNLQRE